MQAAGYADGMYSGPQVTMVADNTPPGSDTAKVVAADLAKIGIKARIISVTHATMYTKYRNVPKNEPNVCPNVGWLPDFHEPQAILDATFNGRTSSLEQLELAAPERAECQLRHGSGGEDPRSRDPVRAVGQDRRPGRRDGAAVPWLWENFPTLFSARVVPALMVDNEGAPDVSYMSVK